MHTYSTQPELTIQYYGIQYQYHENCALNSFNH